jgi:lipid II:glycine glycyltransferase (peptidoglycan interpeptide bridge formation enzyme)
MDYFKDFSSKKLVMLEDLKKNNTTLFQELISTANYYNLVNEDESDSNYSENVKLVKRYQERLKLTQINSDKI